MSRKVKLALPGRHIDELLGSVNRREDRPHRCTGKPDCPDAAHSPHAPGVDVFLWDDRTSSAWHAHHKGDAWVTFWCRDVHPDLLEAWRQHVGDPHDHGVFGLASLEAIYQTDGSFLLLGRAVNSIFHLWITIEELT